MTPYPRPGQPGSFVQPPPPPRKVYGIDPKDTLFALVLVVMGFLFWNWLWPRTTSGSLPPEPGSNGGGVWYATHSPSVAVTAYFILALACSIVYFRLHNLTPTRPAVVGAVAILAAAIPYTLYDTTPLHFLMGPVLIAGYITWHAYAARTAVSPTLDALTTADAINQGFVVPFTNAGSWFAAVAALFRGKKRVGQVVIALAGVFVGLPVILLVLRLLMSADSRFSGWMSSLTGWLGTVNLWSFTGQLILGLPIAFYGFALLYGNARRLGTEIVTARRARGWAASAQGIRQAAIAAPMAVLCLIYVVFFVAMGSYLFSGFAGQLPGDFTYAQYARQGFFQLAAVAGINLVVLAVGYLFAKREAGGRGVMRLLGGVLTGLTVLLVATAMSKMILYIGQFGLSQLRLYTLWFMGVLLVVFVLLAVWYVRGGGGTKGTVLLVPPPEGVGQSAASPLSHPFRVSQPIVVFSLLAFLGLTWANTDGIIAGYNVDHYLRDGGTIDVSYLSTHLSDAALPALVRLADEAPDASVRAAAQTAVDARRTDPARPPTGGIPWESWNWQTWYAGQILG